MALQAAPSAQRAVAIVEYLAAHPDETVPVAELARRLDQSRATCTSVLLALEAADWVHRDADGRYGLGTGLIHPGMAAQRGSALVQLLRPLVADVHRDTGHEATAYLPSGRDLVVVARSGPDHFVPGGVVVGQVFPLVPPYGLASVAWSDDAMTRWLERAPDLGPAATRRLRRAAELVRAHGYAVILDPLSRQALHDVTESLDQDAREQVAELLAQDDLASAGVVGQGPFFSFVSAPVFGTDETVVALLGLFVRSNRPQEIPDLAASVCRAANRASERLGASGSGAEQERSA